MGFSVNQHSSNFYAILICTVHQLLIILKRPLQQTRATLVKQHMVLYISPAPLTHLLQSAIHSPDPGLLFEVKASGITENQLIFPIIDRRLMDYCADWKVCFRNLISFAGLPDDQISSDSSINLILNIIIIHCPHYRLTPVA